jgi:hypothetical protein
MKIIVNEYPPLNVVFICDRFACFPDSCNKVIDVMWLFNGAVSNLFLCISFRMRDTRFLILFNSLNDAETPEGLISNRMRVVMK